MSEQQGGKYAGSVGGADRFRFQLRVGNDKAGFHKTNHTFGPNTLLNNM